MVGAISHTFSAPQADGTIASIVKPSNWNSAHSCAFTIAGNTAGFSSSVGGLTNVLLAGGSNATLSATTDASSNATISVIGQAAVDITQLVGHTSGTGSFPAAVTNLVLAGGNNVTLSAATAGANATVTVNGPQISLYEIGTAGTASSTLAMAPGVVYWQAFDLPVELAMTRLNMYASVSNAFTSGASAAGAQSGSWNSNVSIWAMIYSRGQGASSNTMYSYASSSVGISQTFTVTQSGATSSISGYYTVSYPNSSGTGSQTLSFQTAGCTAAGMSTTLTNACLSGMNEIIIPMVTTLEAGQYFVGLQIQTARTTSGAATVYASVVNGLQLSLSQNIQPFNTAICVLGGAGGTGGTSSAAYQDFFFGMTQASSAATPATSIIIGPGGPMVLVSNGLYPLVLMNYTGVTE